MPRFNAVHLHMLSTGQLTSSTILVLYSNTETTATLTTAVAATAIKETKVVSTHL